MDTVVLALRVALAAVFLAAGIGKLLDQAGARTALVGFGVPPRLRAVMAPLLPILELVTAVALLIQQSARWGAVAAVVLMLAFTGAILRALARESRPQCHCFGIFHSSPAGPKTVLRNAALAALALVVVLAGPGPSLTSWVSSRSTDALVAVGLALAAVMLGLVVLRLRRDNVDLRRQLTAVRTELDALPPGLPIGAVAPNFDVPEVRGGRLTLKSLCDRGLPVLLVFLGKGCEFSMELSPDVARWQRTLADRLTIAVITRGGPEHNAFETEVCGIADIGLQGTSFDVQQTYRVTVTPSGVLISPDGRIARIIAEGTMAIEALLRLALRDDSVAAGGPQLEASVMAPAPIHA